MNLIGKKTRYYREKLGLTQADLAVAMGYKHHSSVGKIEAGINDIPLSSLKKLADVLRVSPVDLFEDSQSHEYSSIRIRAIVDCLSKDPDKLDAVEILLFGKKAGQSLYQPDKMA